MHVRFIRIIRSHRRKSTFVLISVLLLLLGVLYWSYGNTLSQTAMNSVQEIENIPIDSLWETMKQGISKFWDQIVETIQKILN